MRKLFVGVLSFVMVFVLVVPVSAVEVVAFDRVSVRNVHTVSDGDSYVYAGVSLVDRSVSVSRVDGSGVLWSHVLPARASFDFSVGLDVAGSFVAAGGRRHHPVGGFGALFDGEVLLWHKNFSVDVRDVALYDSGESVWAGWNPVTNAASVVFVSASGGVVWEQDFVSGFPSAFDDVELVGSSVVLRGVSLCGQQSVCEAGDAYTYFVVLGQDGSVLSDSSLSLTGMFGVESGFRTVYPWLTVDGFVASPDGFVVSGFGLKDSGEYCLLVAGLDASFVPVWRSGPLFCDDGSELFENRGAVSVTSSGDVVVAVGSYYDVAVSGVSSGSIDFVAAVVGPSGVSFVSQFGTDGTDHAHSVSVFDGNLLIGGDTFGSGVLAFVDVGGGLSGYRAGSVSPGWVVPVVEPEVLTPKAPVIVSVGRSASGLSVAWEPSLSPDVSFYNVSVTDGFGVEVGFCRARSSVRSCVVDLRVNGVYTVSVAAANRFGLGVADARSVVLNFGVPSVPRNVSSSVSRGRIVAGYAVPELSGGSAVSRYVLELYRDGVLISQRANARNKFSFILTGLPAGSYEFRVAALNARGTGDWSDFVSVQVG